MDSELTMKEHVAKIAAACFYHIRRLRQVRRRVGQEVTQQLVLALIMSRLDYNSSTSSMEYSLPRLRTKFGERAFSHAGPATWNALPVNIRTVADPVKYRKLLKSLYFSPAFNI